MVQALADYKVYGKGKGEQSGGYDDGEGEMKARLHTEQKFLYHIQFIQSS